MLFIFVFFFFEMTKCRKQKGRNDHKNSSEEKIDHP